MKSQDTIPQIVEKKWEEIKSLTFEESIKWIENKINQYYSKFIKNKRNVNLLTKKTIAELTQILRYLESRQSPELAVDFFNNFILTYLIFETEDQIPGPVEVSFLATGQMVQINGEALGYIS